MQCYEILFIFCQEMWKSIEYRVFHKNVSIREIAYNSNSFDWSYLVAPSEERQWNVVSYVWKSNPSTSYWQSFAAVKFTLKNVFTKLLNFNFIRKSVDATLYVRKMEARASRGYSQKRSTNYFRSCPGQSLISFRKRTDFVLSKTSPSIVALESCRCHLREQG